MDLNIPPKRHKKEHPSSKEEIVPLSSSAQPRISSTSVNLISNFFDVTLGTDLIFQYDVKFEPEILNKRFKRKIIETLLREKYGSFIFTGTSLYSLVKMEGTFEYQDSKSNTTHILKITEVKSIDQKSSTDVRFQVFNNLIKECLHVFTRTPRGTKQSKPKFHEIGRGRFFDSTKEKVFKEEKITLWPGFKESLNQKSAGVFFCLDTITKVLRNDTAWDVLRNDRGSAKSDILDQVVRTTYSNKFYRVVEIVENQTPESSFTKRNGENMTYLDYYEKTYGIRKQKIDPRQPLLKVVQKRKGAEETIYLIPELCYLTGLSSKHRSDHRLMEKLSTFLNRDPTNRESEWRHFIKDLNNPASENPNELVGKLLKDWKAQISRNPVKVEGKIYEMPTIAFGKDQGGRTQTKQYPSANWNTFGKDRFCFSESRHCKEWMIVYPKNQGDEVKYFYETLNKVYSPLVNQSLPKPFQCKVSSDDVRDFIDCMKNDYKPNMVFVVVILPTDQADRYSKIKQHLIEQNVPSQCVKFGTIRNSSKLMSVCTKIALQINTKMGGIPWRIEGIEGKLARMIIGIDICHDKLGKNKVPIAGFVASINSSFTRYFSKTVETSGKNDSPIPKLYDLMKQALAVYKERNGNYPQEVIVFRDGVGESQMKTIQDEELIQLKQACDKEQIKFAYIVVQKKVGAKFLKDTGKYFENPGPGTVVDSKIVDSERTDQTGDFYLIAHTIKKGATVAPIHCHVLTNETSFHIEVIQYLTFQMCHLYFNWTGTIRVPAPCQYAHKVAFFQSQYLKTQVKNDSFASKLYYI